MDTSKLEGLSAKDVAVMRAKFGFNELPDKDRRNIFKIIFGLLTEPMIFLLLVTVI